MTFVNALKSNLSAVKFNYAEWSKVQELGFTELYKEDGDIWCHIKMITALSHFATRVVEAHSNGELHS